ncbi:MAG: sigma 54-interacting transcriptional regulator [Geobacteraceae bacterium]|nr:sigma 54-interacting transcriptional regulator [Geobacteraceae bacterium]
MATNRSTKTSSTALRGSAEKKVNATKSGSEDSLATIEAERLLHELQVHQVELEMQNEELQRIREELEVSRNSYSELYDFAPVGYFVFDSRGRIREVNLTGSQLLGVERGALVNRPFTGFISDEGERKVFSDHLRMVLQRKILLRCELSFTGTKGTKIHGRFQSVAFVNHKEGCILTTLFDCTARKQLEEELQRAHDRLELTVGERTRELTSTNLQLTQEIEERRKAEASLQEAFAEIKGLKDRLQAENIYLQQEVGRQHNFGEIIGQSQALGQVFSKIEQVAPMNATVLLLGETGTGKGVVANTIHSRSSRRGRPLITVNCTTLPATLVESELFGRERGAFTGAGDRQIGHFELADGGTIFLDEIGEMPLELQSKLLRVIQDGEFERLGSPRTIKTDVRIIAATNRNLAEEVKNGTFREDLFYRLNVFPITMPPLRQRKDDIPLLVNHFVAKFNSKIGKRIESISKETLNTLEEYHWPGNVRELESVIERAVIMSPGSSLQVLDRFDTFRKAEEPAGEDIRALVELEHDHVLQVLKKTGWRIEGKNGAAVLLGLNASTLRARMRKYGIVRQ